MNLDKKRWGILIICCLINLCIGSLYAWSVFSGPFAARLSELTGSSLTAADLALVFTMANAVGPVTMISGGAINDKLGPKWVIFTGGLVFGSGMMLSGFATTTMALVFSYGVLIGLGMGLVYGCTVSHLVKFFPDKRGLIGGIAVASYGLSSVILPPIATALIDARGISTTCAILGGTFLSVICIGGILIPQCPAGYTPAGWAPPAAQSGGRVKDKSWRLMLADKIFYIMFFMLTCGAFFGLMMTSQAKPIALNMIEMTPTAATVVVSALALFNALGRVLCGYISDRIGRINTCTGVFGFAIIGMLCLYFSSASNIALFYIGICITGFCFGSFMGVYPSFTADQFGGKNNSVNYGIMFIGFALAGILGPIIMSAIYKSSGSYNPAFLIAIGLCLLGLALTVVFRHAAAKGTQKRPEGKAIPEAT